MLACVTTLRLKRGATEAFVGRDCQLIVLG